MKRSLYVTRSVLNATEILEWAKEQGFTSTLPPEDLHVTIMYSRRPVDWSNIPKGYKQNEQIEILDGAPSVYSSPTGDSLRSIKPLGDKGAVVLTIPGSYSLESRWSQLKDAGCSWDYKGYQPHMTITYEGAPSDLSVVQPFYKPIVLGPEIWAEVEENWSEDIMEATFAKINEEKRIVYGWASIITKNGQPIEDLQGDVIHSDDLVEAAHDFMLGEQEAGLMHVVKTGIGKIVESVVLTKELQNALGINLGMEGWFIGVKVSDDATWDAVKKGGLRAFSIGGTGEREEIAK
jgi:hypothetical protein